MINFHILFIKSGLNFESFAILVSGHKQIIVTSDSFFNISMRKSIAFLFSSFFFNLSLLLPAFQWVIFHHSYYVFPADVWADIIPVFWLQLASLAEWYADYTKWLLFPCSNYKLKCFWASSWWTLFNLWKVVSMLKDNTSVDSFGFSKRRKIFTGT